jgi:hypothetical protein
LKINRVAVGEINMKYFLFAVALLVACIASASGANETASSIDVSNLSAALIKDAYDGSIGGFPEEYKALIGDNRISIKIIGNDSSVNAFGLVTKGGQLEEAIEGELLRPTIEINAKESAILELQKAEDPKAAFDNAIAKNEISVKGNGFLNQLKVNVLLGHPVLPEMIVQILTPTAQQGSTG